MKGFDTFLVSLVIIFIIFALLLAASSFFPYYPEGAPAGMRVLHNFTAGSVGYSADEASRSQSFGSFGVGVPQQEVLRSAPRMEITAGLFGSSGERFSIAVPGEVFEYLKGGGITFDVADTNQYGNLVILWNGAEVFGKKAARGKYSIVLEPSQIKEQNTLDVAAQGPGLLFWAATVYDIRDFSVFAEYGPAKFAEFDVSRDELETLDRFELSWFTANRRGTLVIKVNGEDIFSRSPERTEKISFTDADLDEALINAGTNRLTFAAVNGSFELQDVTLTTFSSRNQRTVKERFSLTGTQAASLKAKGGVVKLYVESIARAGELRVKLNEQAAGAAQAKTGWNSVSFDGSLAQEGTNWIELGGTGSFDVGDVSVEIA